MIKDGHACDLKVFSFGDSDVRCKMKNNLNVHVLVECEFSFDLTFFSMSDWEELFAASSNRHRRLHSSPYRLL
jgi:hypothetical protein